jgi:hypothetical protein
VVTKERKIACDGLWILEPKSPTTIIQRINMIPIPLCAQIIVAVATIVIGKEVFNDDDK